MCATWGSTYDPQHWYASSTLIPPTHTHVHITRTHTLTQILQEIQENGIKIYQFPDTDGDEEEAAANKKLRVGRHTAWCSHYQLALSVWLIISFYKENDSTSGSKAHQIQINFQIWKLV